jgi:hypothetical protein
VGYINRAGKYVQGTAPITKPNEQYHSFRHEAQRLDHRKDIIQPWERGRPNSEFIKNYPENAKNYFTEQQIKEGMNG